MTNHGLWRLTALACTVAASAAIVLAAFLSRPTPQPSQPSQPFRYEYHTSDGAGFHVFDKITGEIRLVSAKNERASNTKPR